MKSPIVALFVALAFTACASSGDSDPDAGDATVDCGLPWSTLDQVSGCGSSDYTVAETEGDQIVHIVVESKDPDAIAGAMAHAWSAHIPSSSEGVVWVYSHESLVGSGYDRGVLSEQGMLGEELVFQICTTWEEFEGLGELCGEEMEFTVVQD